MYFFHNDYNEVCHPRVLDRLTSLTGSQLPGYGEDPCCHRAAELIRELCENDHLAVHFLMGGTQTNLTVIAAALRPHQAVIGADSAHIQIHETGAIEATGHKLLTVSSTDGKLTAEQIEAMLPGKDATDLEHMAQPKMVYISQSTELGTVYTRAELEAISAVCKANRLYLFMDGARLGYGLMSRDCDLTLPDLARLCDVFYLGGTKQGAMFGEAVVIANPQIAEDFRYIMKQRGAMLAKGFLLGAQFEALLEDGLYFDLAERADRMADTLRETLSELSVPLLVPGSTNMVFPVLPDSVLEKLAEGFTFTEQERVDDTHRAVRFCTSWATTRQSVDALCDALRKLLTK